MLFVTAAFVVVDAEGSVVDLAVLVSAAADAIAVADLSEGDDVFDRVVGLDGLSLRVRGVRVCAGFQFSASSHTGRELESETEEVCE